MNLVEYAKENLSQDTFKDDVNKRIDEAMEAIDLIYKGDGIEVDWDNNKTFVIGHGLSIELGVDFNPYLAMVRASGIEIKREPRYTIEVRQWHKGTNRYLHSNIKYSSPKIQAEYLPHLHDFVKHHVDLANKQRSIAKKAIKEFDEKYQYLITNKDGEEILVMPVIGNFATKSQSIQTYTLPQRKFPIFWLLAYAALVALIWTLV